MHVYNMAGKYNRGELSLIHSYIVLARKDRST